MIRGLYDFATPWSAKGSVWLYSDPHFDDEDMVELLGYPPPEVQVDNINKVAFKNDHIIFLGDMGNPEWLRKLKCKNLVCVLGNHDKGASYYADYFKDIFTGPVFISDRILLSHEPVRDTPFCFNFHGHCHGQTENDWQHMNVCADVINFSPVNLGSVIKSGVLKDIPTIHRLAIDKQIHEKDIKKCNQM